MTVVLAMVVTKRNDEKLDAWLSGVQLMSREGNITLADLYRACSELETRLGLPPKDINGLKVEVDMNPGESGGTTTHFYLERINHVWHVTDVLRSHRQTHKFYIEEMPERTERAILYKFRRF